MKNYIFLLLGLLVFISCTKESLRETKLNVSKTLAAKDLISPTGITLANDTNELKKIVIKIFGDSTSLTVDRVKYFDAKKV